MTTLSESVWNSLKITEGYRTTIYNDGKGIPTIGLGLALIKISGGVSQVPKQDCGLFEHSLISPHTSINGKQV